MKKVNSLVFIFALSTLMMSTFANVSCPDTTQMICKNGQWKVKGGKSSWVADKGSCAAGATTISLRVVSTLTTSYTDKTTFASGPFKGDYKPIRQMSCSYTVSDNSIAVARYTKKAKSNFAKPSAWIYRTLFYVCTSVTSSDCALQ